MLKSFVIDLVANYNFSFQMR